MADSKVRIGFVGVGSMGQCAHLKNYVTLPDVEVVALAEIREGLGRKVAARYGVPRVYNSHTEMLAEERLDGIVASQPFNRHGILAPELYKAGIPIFTEKPLAASVQVGEQILQALANSASWHMVGYHKRSDPAAMLMRAEINQWKESGELGRMTYARILMPAGDWVAGGFNDLIRDDGPAPALAWDPPAPDMDADTYQKYVSFVNYYIHQVNLARYLLGEPYRVTYADPSGVLLAGQSQSGVAVSIEMSPYRTTLDWQESALVCFEKGWLRLAVAPDLGFALVSMEYQNAAGKTLVRWISEDFRLVGDDTYFPFRSRFVTHLERGERVQEFLVREVSHWNDALPDYTFALQVPFGTRVRDSRPGVPSTVFVLEEQPQLEMLNRVLSPDAAEPARPFWRNVVLLLNGMGLLCLVIYWVYVR